MHFSRMHTVRFYGHLYGGGVSAQGCCLPGGRCPGVGVCPGVSAQGGGVCVQRVSTEGPEATPPWTQRQTHTPWSIAY